jgi:alkylation response protein AidB-like acyl-CoA dehydrogenase
MKFGLTDTQQLLRSQMRTFVAERIVGENLGWGADANFPGDVLDSLGEMGILGMTIPQEHGGEGLDP